jgi:hypothetical protein
MKKHIPFHKLSDLYDEKIPSRSERASLHEHIESCSQCREDYEKLHAMIGMVQGMTAYRIRESSFVAETMKRVKLLDDARRKRHRRYTALSAAAAGFILIITYGMFSFMRDVERNDVLKRISALEEEYRNEQEQSPKNYDVMKTDYDRERVLSILQRNKARVYDVYEKHVEGEVGLSSLRKLKRELAERSRQERPGQRRETVDQIEEGFGYDVIPEREWTSLIDDDPVIRFRVNLK